MQTQDIDTTAAAPLPPLKDLPALFEAVAEAARTQLVINAAKIQMQAEVEAAKVGFEKATSAHEGRVASLLAQIEQYAKEHKDELFPVKNGKQAKSFAILQHVLQFRTSTAVVAPAGSETKLVELAASYTDAAINEPNKSLSADYANHADRLRALLRQPPAELNKEAVSAADDGMKQFLKDSLGIHEVTSEAFKVAFKFSPQQTAAAKA